MTFGCARIHLRRNRITGGYEKFSTGQEFSCEMNADFSSVTRIYNARSCADYE